MLACLMKYFLVLMSLWFARYFKFIPPTDLVTMLVIVVVPMLIAVSAWQAGKRQAVDEKLSQEENTLDTIITDFSSGAHLGRS